MSFALALKRWKDVNPLDRREMIALLRDEHEISCDCGSADDLSAFVSGGRELAELLEALEQSA